MWGVWVFMAVLAVVLLVALHLSMRWGRGARGGDEPKNQTTTPWKMWPF
jgi:uncharacterized membrane protein